MGYGVTVLRRLESRSRRWSRVALLHEEAIDSPRKYEKNFCDYFLCKINSLGFRRPTDRSIGGGIQSIKAISRA